jgi:hypothetical protein
MAANDMSAEEIRTAGLEILLRELGPDGLVRFLQQFETGSGDYTRDRSTLLAGITLEEIIAKAEAQDWNSTPR